MPYPFTFNGRTYTLEDFQGTNYVDGIPDLMYDAAQHFGLPYQTTSKTRNGIDGVGTKNFTLEEQIPYVVGTPLRIADVANPATNWIDGIVTAIAGKRVRIEVIGYSGAGQVSNWSIMLGGCAPAVPGIVPVSQGGTGSTSLQALANDLGVLTRTEADRLYTSAIGILGIYRGGTNADNIIDARKNLELYSKTEVDARIQQLGGGLKGTPEEMRNTLDVYSTGQSDGRYLRSGLTLGISAGGTGATTVVDARNNLNVYGRSETFGKFETYNRDQVYNRRDSDNRYLLKGAAVPVTSGGTGGTSAVEARQNLNVYSKDNTYNKNEVYNKNEIYGKAELYSRTESDSRYFSINPLRTPLRVEQGGTGATTPDRARAALDLYSKTEVDAKLSSSTGIISGTRDQVFLKIESDSIEYLTIDTDANSSYRYTSYDAGNNTRYIIIRSFLTVNSKSVNDYLRGVSRKTKGLTVRFPLEFELYNIKMSLSLWLGLRESTYWRPELEVRFTQEFLQPYGAKDIYNIFQPSQLTDDHLTDIQDGASKGVSPYPFYLDFSAEGFTSKA